MSKSKQMEKSLPFKQNFFGSLQQTAEWPREWHTFLKCVRLWIKYLDFWKELGKNKYIPVTAIYCSFFQFTGFILVKMTISEGDCLFKLSDVAYWTNSAPSINGARLQIPLPLTDLRTVFHMKKMTSDD